MCEYAHAHTLPRTQALEAFMYLQCDHAPPPVWEQRQIVYAELILNKRRRLVKPSQIILPSQEFSN